MSDTVIVTAGLVQYLRSGLRTEFGFAAQRIATCMLDFEDEPPVDEYERSVEIFDAARALLSDIAPTGDQPQEDIELDLSSNALLVLKSFECQYNAEIDRLQEAALYGRNRDAAHEEVRALGDLVMLVKRHVQRQGGHQAELLPELPLRDIGVRARRARGIPRGSRPRR